MCGRPTGGGTWTLLAVPYYAWNTRRLLSQAHTSFVKFALTDAGIGVTSTGHSHPKVVKAIQEQAADMIFAQQNVFLGSKPLVGIYRHYRVSDCSICCMRM